MKDFSKEIKKRDSEGLLRKLPKDLPGIDFLSNDYLGLSRLQVSFTSPNGSSGSRLLSGNYAAINDFESELCDYHKSESALIYVSGYSANLGVLSCLPSRGDSVIMDELCHASLIDGVLLSKAQRIRFKHNDILDLEKETS